MTNEELIQRHKAGDPDAMWLLIKKNSGAIYRVSRKFSRVDDMEDCLQECAMTVMRCVRLFDPKKDIRFITYLFRSMWCHLFRWRRMQQLIHVPVKCEQGVRERFVPASIDYQESEMTHFLCSTDEQPDIAAANADEESLWSRRLAALMEQTLTDRERVILWQWADDKTFEEIGQSVGITKQRVHQIQSKAIQKLLTTKAILG